PCYRCLFREPPPPGLVPNCAEGGVLGVLPGIIGSMQAMETVKLLLGVGETLAGRLLIFDALEMSWREVRLRKNPECPVCADQPTQTELIDYEIFCGLSRGTASPEEREEETVEEIEPEALIELLGSAEPPFLVDVRDPWEWAVSSLADQGARLIPVGEIDNRISEIPRDMPVVVYCRSGQRGLAAAHLLKKAGYVRVFNLSGGILGWAESVEPGLPVV
ncbi:MAG TPA: molybdenum cofactor biosynthesis protein MoeB, partial [Gemmatimonadetes bacterium]|nr:molybdenum cofactor biosynthesis protein MoeB [Gemmatimonadota bacterium]